MQHSALEILQEDHAALASVFRVLRAAVRPRMGGATPDFELLRSMLFYLDGMPARLHHAIEEQFLFPKIRERCPPLRPVLDRLEAEHARGDAMVQSLQRALTAWQVNGAEQRETFELLLRVYVDGYLGHLEVEENYVLSVAQEYLSTADWLELHAAFACHRGKLAAASPTGAAETHAGQEPFDTAQDDELAVVTTVPSRGTDRADDGN